MTDNFNKCAILCRGPYDVDCPICRESKTLSLFYLCTLNLNLLAILHSEEYPRFLVITERGCSTRCSTARWEPWVCVLVKCVVHWLHSQVQVYPILSHIFLLHVATSGYQFIFKPWTLQQGFLVFLSQCWMLLNFQSQNFILDVSVSMSLCSKVMNWNCCQQHLYHLFVEENKSFQTKD